MTFKFIFLKTIPLPYYFIVALAALLWLPWLLAKGMFMDGLYDGLLAQNLAHGVSTFWAPQTNDYSNPAYWNNPPLSMFTLGCFYKVFGDAYMVDKIYSLGCAVVQLLLLAWAWRIFWRSDTEIKQYSWLPCLLWLISPLTGWCYSNNLMENTMSILTTSSLILFLLFVHNRKNLLLYSFAGAAFIFMAFITKGPAGLFPLAVPILFFGSKREAAWKELLSYLTLQVVFFALLFAIIFSLPEPKNFLHQYFAFRLGPAINHNLKPETETDIIFKEMLLMLLPLLVLYAVSFFISNKKEKTSDNKNVVYASGFILSGLAASLPIAISLVQRKFYLLPSLPMFALGFSILILPLVKFVEQQITSYANKQIYTVAECVCVLIIFICIFFCVKNKNSFSRDKELLTDIENMLPLIGKETAVCADWQLYGEWSFRAYCTRYYDKKIYMPDRVSETKFYITKPNEKGDKLAPDALKIYSGSTFDIYQTKF